MQLMILMCNGAALGKAKIAEKSKAMSLAEAMLKLQRALRSASLHPQLHQWWGLCDRTLRSSGLRLSFWLVYPVYPVLDSSCWCWIILILICVTCWHWLNLVNRIQQVFLMRNRHWQTERPNSRGFQWWRHLTIRNDGELCKCYPYISLWCPEKQTPSSCTTSAQRRQSVGCASAWSKLQQSCNDL